jgi:hypothetical protein
MGAMGVMGAMGTPMAAKNMEIHLFHDRLPAAQVSNTIACTFFVFSAAIGNPIGRITPIAPINGLPMAARSQSPPVDWPTIDPAPGHLQSKQEQLLLL